MIHEVIPEPAVPNTYKMELHGVVFVEEEGGTWRTANFKTSEFVCPCCGKDGIDLRIPLKLQQIRDIVKIPMMVTSGYRCEKHNRAVGGSENSTHMKGLAADIYVAGPRSAYEIVQAAFKIGGIEGIGIKQEGSKHKRFIHFDVWAEKFNEPGVPRPALWTY